jgi:membrane protein YqaA with SNARE-associated domain
MRRIWAFFVWSAVLVSALLTIAAGFPTLRPAILFLFYSIPANSLIPIPHEPGVLYFSLLASPLALASAGVVGVFLASYFDHWLLGWLVRSKAGRALERSRSWQFMTRMFLKAPFVTIMAIAVTGLAVQAARILAASAGYPTRRYALAMALGRFPRFYLIALLGRALSLPGWLLGGLTIAFLAWPLFLVLRAPPADESLEEPAA